MADSKKFTTIDEYIKSFPGIAGQGLREIRTTVRKAAPEAEELISYRMPAFKYNGKILIYFSAWKEHIGVYPPPPKAMQKEVAKYAGPKGNLQFPLSKKIPLPLIRKIVKERIKELDAPKKAGKRARKAS
jgi:uncharacterized protein YdhG (YjbR/CyaY superfamily)